MKSVPKIVFTSCWLGLVVVLAMTMPSVASTTVAQLLNATTKEEKSSADIIPSLPQQSEDLIPLIHLGGIGRFLTDRPRQPQKSTCNNNPRVCRSKGSRGPNCCNNQCVNVMTDKDNCGKCGKRCSYTTTCCQGRCVNPAADDRHCGRCNNPCRKGSSCVYGLCSYAT